MNSRTYKSINEVSDLLKIKKHVIRYWDSRFDGVSTRLGENKRRIFNSENIKKLIIIKKMLHNNGKRQYSLELAKKILESNVIKNNITGESNTFKKKLNIDKLSKISENLKKILESLD